MSDQKEFIRGANPYMPLWEHVPDGEPHVFTYNGETRIYVYGSHDTLGNAYCGPDYVVWSAPVDDLTDWTCHGVSYTAPDGEPLYAPDVVEKDGVYYLYAAEQRNSRITVSTSTCPWGPFTDRRPTELGADPGVLVDDDGRVYAYWGFCASYCAELNDDMATIKPGTLHAHPIPHCDNVPWVQDTEHVDHELAFFEASSPRKVLGKYVFVYSKRVQVPHPELGVFEDNNGFLSYQFSAQPLEGFHGGGDISFNGGEILADEDGRGMMTMRWGNNHGSIVEINGQWYVFYHRQTGTDEHARQAMLEPIEVAQDDQGNVFIGKVIRRDGQPVASVPVEMTSQGPHVNGLDCRKWISAGYACHLHGCTPRPVISVVRQPAEEVSTPVTGIKDGTTVGFRYLAFGETSPATVTALLQSAVPAEVTVRLDAFDGPAIAVLHADAQHTTLTADLTASVTGKHAVYFHFAAQDPQAELTFDRFTFD